MTRFIVFPTSSIRVTDPGTESSISVLIIITHWVTIIASMISITHVVSSFYSGGNTRVIVPYMVTINSCIEK